MRRQAERGLAVSVEAVIVLPALMLFLGVLVTLARIVLAEQDVAAAAAAAAREATLVHVGRAGVAETATQRALTERAVPCATTGVFVGSGSTTGAVETVMVRVTCRVSLADFSLPFVPGWVDIAAERTSPVDPYR